MPNRVTKGFVVALLATVLLVPFGCTSAAATAPAPYAFTSFDYPDAVVTQAYGINAGGDIVGTYQGAKDVDSTVWKGTKQSHGFLLKDGKFTSFDYPSASGQTIDCTIATAIGPGGDIVGYYGVVGKPLTNAEGFLYTKNGKWSTYPNPVDPALGEPTMKPSPMRIMPDGRTVG